MGVINLNCPEHILTTNSERISQDLKPYIWQTLEKILIKNINNKRKEIPLFDIFGSGYYLGIERKDYKIILTQLLKQYEKVENYEKCSKIQKMIEKCL
jgi:hypothetical protein